MISDIYSKKQIDVLKQTVNKDWFIALLHGAKRSGKTKMNNDLFLFELRRVRKIADEEGVKEPMYILAGVSSNTINKNILQELYNMYNIEPKFDKHNNFKLFGVKVVQAYTGNIGEVDASYLTKQMDENSVAVLRDALLEDIHKVTYVPNMNDKNFSGNVSGEAMKYKLFGLLQLMSVKERYMIKGLRQRLILFANYLEISNNNVDIDGIKINLKPNLPINTTDIINQIVQAHQAGILPLKVLLAWLPDIDNVDEVLEQLQEEKEEAIELNQKAMGVQSGDSHSNLDDPPDENEEENQDNNNKQSGNQTDQKGDQENGQNKNNKKQNSKN
ncbi:MAG: phage portal protein [Staphylococcus xylosus]